MLGRGWRREQILNLSKDLFLSLLISKTANNPAYGRTETVGEGISMDNNPAYEKTNNSKEQQENEYELYDLPGPSSQEPD